MASRSSLLELPAGRIRPPVMFIVCLWTSVRHMMAVNLTAPLWVCPGERKLLCTYLNTLSSFSTRSPNVSILTRLISARAVASARRQVQRPCGESADVWMRWHSAHYKGLWTAADISLIDLMTLSITHTYTCVRKYVWFYRWKCKNWYALAGLNTKK